MPARPLLIIVSAALALGAAGAAAAQDMPTVLPNNYVLSDILNTQRVTAAIGAGPAGGAQAGSAPRSGARPPASSALPATSYRADPQVSMSVRKQFSDWVGRSQGPDEGRKIAAVLTQMDPVGAWSQLVASDGLRAGDTADALTAYWVLNWIMATGGDNNRTQTLAVREQVRGILANNPGYVRLDDRQRQTFAETLMLNFLLQHAAYADAMKRGDRDTARKLGDAATARFRTEMGVDLRQLQLTNAGFARGR